jgi:AcrR family transcriptional regulator
MTTEPSPVRRPSTKERLIDTGERLFGRFGIDAVSLREIAAAAGQTNSNAVQYHFKDKRGLIVAIMDRRLLGVEGLRCELLKMTEQSYPDDPRELLRTLWEPFMSVRSADGQHPFCRFLLQYLLQPLGAEYPPRNLEAYNRSRQSPPDLRCLTRTRRLLRAHYSNLSKAAFGSRLSTVSMMFLSAVVEHDNGRVLVGARNSREFDLESMLDLSTAALSAPVRRSATRQSAAV